MRVRQAVSDALSLVKQLAAPFDPEKFVDEYRERVLERIEQKAKGQALTPGAAPKAATVGSLEEALERSLSLARNEEKPAPALARRPAQAHARRRRSA